MKFLIFVENIKTCCISLKFTNLTFPRIWPPREKKSIPLLGGRGGIVFLTFGRRKLCQKFWETLRGFSRLVRLSRRQRRHFLADRLLRRAPLCQARRRYGRRGLVCGGRRRERRAPRRRRVRLLLDVGPPSRCIFATKSSLCVECCQLVAKGSFFSEPRFNRIF